MNNEEVNKVVLSENGKIYQILSKIHSYLTERIEKQEEVIENVRISLT